MQNCKNHNEKQFGHNVKKAPKGVIWKDSAAKFPSIRLSKLRKRQPVTTVFDHTLGLSLISKIVPYSKGKEKKRKKTDITFCLWLQQTNWRESMAGAVVRALAFHHYAPGSISRPAVIRGLGLLVLYFALWYSSFPLLPKINIWFDLICWFVIIQFHLQSTQRVKALCSAKSN